MVSNPILISKNPDPSCCAQLHFLQIFMQTPELWQSCQLYSPFWVNICWTKTQLNQWNFMTFEVNSSLFDSEYIKNILFFCIRNLFLFHSKHAIDVRSGEKLREYRFKLQNSGMIWAIFKLSCMVSIQNLLHRTFHTVAGCGN